MGTGRCAPTQPERKRGPGRIGDDLTHLCHIVRRSTADGRVVRQISTLKTFF